MYGRTRGGSLPPEPQSQKCWSFPFAEEMEKEQMKKKKKENMKMEEQETMEKEKVKEKGEDDIEVTMLEKFALDFKNSLDETNNKLVNAYLNGQNKSIEAVRAIGC